MHHGGRGSCSSTGGARSSTDWAGVIAKFGVEPPSIPDYLALVGDTSDGIPGVPGWGAKTTATVLARYRHLEEIPSKSGEWDISVRAAPRLAQSLAQHADDALLYRRLATVDTNAVAIDSIDELEWAGPRTASRRRSARSTPTEPSRASSASRADPSMDP